MKKILSLAFAAAIAMTAQAQTTFGIKGGLNLTSVNTNDEDFNHDRKTRPSFHVGGVADIGISNSFSIQPQLLVQGKGVSLAHGGHSDKIRFTSIDIPVNFLYKRSGFFIGGGPNLGINVSGKMVADDPTENTDFEFGSETGKFKRVNIGANVMTGYQLTNGLFFSANFLGDLTNWVNSNNDKWKNNLFGLSVGYMFKGR
ncbi:outer membrane beta-barrel protein [Aridibaculum aurantiacum]|uniref:outer membrane beta-barrel protein n=1 Tax=Aridibaculum aurantiacum TaxID=2810307 RepID=UPI001A96F282|nr:outer membrane beta-barrel protein [Aridibaculum aurantiacum]